MADNKKFHLLQDSGLTLYAKKPEGALRHPTFRIKMVENNPHFIVNTGFDNNSGKPITIEANFSSRQFYNALETIREVLMSQTPLRLMIQNYDHRWVDNGSGKRERTKDIHPHSLFAVEKKEDGSIVLSITAGTKLPFIEFDFKDNVNGQGRVYHLFMDADRNPMPTNVASRIATRAYISLAEKYVAAWQSTNAEEPKWMVERRQKYAGGMNGQNNAGSNGSYGQQRQPSAPSVQQPPVGLDDMDFL
ncbi:hypothetical protein ACLPJK_26230 [Pseudomonas aeruginosa]|uniref:hypothetical protein n=1 Tax=Pseudomonas aeruginosa TaxID=287 RepID=UPI003D267311